MTVVASFLWTSVGPSYESYAHFFDQTVEASLEDFLKHKSLYS